MNNAEPGASKAPALLSRRRFTGVATAAVAATLVSGTGQLGRRTARAESADPVVSWINQHAAPLRTTEAKGAQFDLYPLRRIVGDARIVGLGYGAHGTHTVTTLHLRAIRYLVEHLGFRTVAWEESWGSGVIIDRYVVTGEGDARAVVDQAFPIIRHEGFLEVVRWLREFNAGRPDHDKVRFVGNDVLEVRDLLYDRVTRYVTDVAPGRLGELNEHLDPIRMHGNPQETIIWYLDPAKTEEWREQLIAHARAVYDLVRGLPDAPSSVEYLDAVQDAHTILGFYDFLCRRGTVGDVREHYISAFTNRWMERHPATRMVYLAHNGHIGANPRMTVSIPDGQPPDDDSLDRALSGGYLRRDYGRDYVAIGTCFGSGQVFVGWQTGPRVYDIPAPDPSFVDRTLGEAVAPNYLLDLNAPGPQPPEVQRWLNGPAKIRFIASAYEASNDTNYKQTNDPWREGFDAMFYVHTVETARMFPM